MQERYRIMAIDYGTKRVGIAISDELRMLASPRGILENSKQLIPQIRELARNEGVKLVLLGIPRTLTNTESAMTNEVLAFKGRLESALQEDGITLQARDERLTSVLANFNISQRGLPKGKRENKALRDEEAARILLQEYLDSN